MKDRIRSTHVHDNDGKDDQPSVPDAERGRHHRLEEDHGAAALAPGQYPLLLELSEVPEYAAHRSSMTVQRNLRETGGASSRCSKFPRITIAEAGQHVGETVEIAGWLYNLRKSGKIVFPLLRDGTGIMQCVAVKSALPEELFETIEEPDAGIVADRHRQDPRRAARARRL